MKGIMKALNKFILHSYDIIEAVGSLVVMVIILIVTAGIISRYVFNSPISWTEEICCLLLIWLCYLAASLTTVEKQHVVADFLSSKLSPRFARAESFFIRVMEVVFLFFTAYAVIVLIPSLTYTSAVLRIPRMVYYLPVVIFSTYMGIAIIVDLLNELIPGYNYFGERYARRAAEEARLQEEENQAMLKREEEFMGEAGIGTAEPEGGGKE